MKFSKLDIIKVVYFPHVRSQDKHRVARTEKGARAQTAQPARLLSRSRSPSNYSTRIKSCLPLDWLQLFVLPVNQLIVRTLLPVNQLFRVR